VVFQKQLPDDVPGWKDADARRAQLRQLLAALKLEPAGADVKLAKLGSGRVYVGDLEAALTAAGVVREAITDHPGVMFIRRQHDDGHTYFLANQGMTPMDGWFTLGVNELPALLDPLTGQTGFAQTRKTDGGVAVRLQVEPGHSLIIKTFTAEVSATPAWVYRETAGAPQTIAGPWQVEFIATPAPGSAPLPKKFETAKLESWTQNGDPETVTFAGTARYTTKFDWRRTSNTEHPTSNIEPSAINHQPFTIDLGEVCHSARVKLNGRDLGTLIMHPYRVAVPADVLKAVGNELEIEVTNLAANRIRDLDRRKVEWKFFKDINFVNIGYKPFDASKWPVFDSGLLGPVTLAPLNP
jgi:hypothetical protein